MKRRRVLFIQLSQFRIFLRKFAVSAVVFVALGLIVLGKSGNAYLNAFQSGVSRVLNPVIRVFELPGDGVYFLYAKVSDIVRVYQENKSLKEEKKIWQSDKSRLQALRLENRLLAEMLHYTPPKEAEFITAKVISVEGDGFSHSLTVFIPDMKDVKKGQVVLHEANLIGRIDDINGAYARVLLITDISSKIPVLIERTNAKAILSGNNTDMLNLLYTTSENAPVVGDKIVTSGVGGIFPSGLDIGRIVSADTHEIKVKAFANIESIEYVYIVDYGFETPLLLEEEKH